MEFVIGVILFIAVVAAAVSAGRAALAAQAINMRIAAIQALLIVGLQHQGVDISTKDPPCRICGQRGLVVELKRNAKGKLQCPKCGGVRE